VCQHDDDEFWVFCRARTAWLGENIDQDFIFCEIAFGWPGAKAEANARISHWQLSASSPT
jgi:hypothetical protein